MKSQVSKWVLSSASNVSQLQKKTTGNYWKLISRTALFAHQNWRNERYQISPFAQTQEITNAKRDGFCFRSQYGPVNSHDMTSLLKAMVVKKAEDANGWNPTWKIPQVNGAYWWHVHWKLMNLWEYTPGKLTFSHLKNWWLKANSFPFWVEFGLFFRCKLLFVFREG